MKLYGSLTSPFVRAVRIAAIELGQDKEIEFVSTVVRPTQPNRDYGDAVNPLRRVPALETGEGHIIIDSRVIIEFLNERAKGAIIPSTAPLRLDALSRHAVAAGATESLVLAMYERRLRPEERHWSAWDADQVDKAQAAFDWTEARCAAFARAFDIGAIGLVCLLGYAAFRFPEVDWLKGRPNLAAYHGASMQRPSVATTAPTE